MIASLIASGASAGAKNNMSKGWGPLQSYADPGDFFGGNSAQAMDPIGYGIFNALGIGNWNPLQVAADKIPGFQGSTTGGGGSGIPTAIQTGGNAGLMSAYANFLRNLGAPPMQAQPRPQAAAMPVNAGDRGGGMGMGFPGMSALSRMNFQRP